jgi:hypothetical protein
MIKKIGTDTYKVNPVLEHALEVLSSSTPTTSRTAAHLAVRLRAAASDPFPAVAGVNAPYGPLRRR